MIIGRNINVGTLDGITLIGNRQRDPSRTTTLRARFDAELKRRFKALTRAMFRSIYTEDVFGLREEDIKIYADITTPGRRQYNFPRDSRKVSAFMDWLQRQIDNGILDVREIHQVGESVEGAWTNKYIYDSYKRGVERARYQMRQAGADIPSLEETGGGRISMMAPLHVERVGMLYTRVFNELKGITAAMDQQISRVLADGLAEGISPRTLAVRLRRVVEGSGGDLAITDSLGRYIPARRRATMLARTEIVRAHAHGQLQEFQNWGVVDVTAEAELITAGDDRVCTECSQKEGNRYPIQEAWSVIPVHTQCRCAWIPVIK
jgi:SPP1 gp7 family putative phage head morphogenesis protein